jgi:hypothetical protein
MAKSDNLSIRERRLVKNIASGGFNTYKDAMIDAGYTESVASKLAYQVLGKPSVKNALQKALEKVGLSDDFIATGIKEGCEATKVISANVIVKGKSGDEMKEADGMTKDFIDVEDYPTRLKALDMAIKLKGGYPKAEIELSGEVGVYRAEFAKPLKEITGEDE